MIPRKGDERSQPSRQSRRLHENICGSAELSSKQSTHDARGCCVQLGTDSSSKSCKNAPRPEPSLPAGRRQGQGLQPGRVDNNAQVPGCKRGLAGITQPAGASFTSSPAPMAFSSGGLGRVQWAGPETHDLSERHDRKDSPLLSRSEELTLCYIIPFLRA